MQGYLAEVRLFVTVLFGAPKGWLPCDGRLMNIAENPALFSLLGTTFGGDGIRTFALPKRAGPGSGVGYIVCVKGLFPSQDSGRCRFGRC